MASCEDYLELISAKLDNELTDDEDARLSSHLEQCPQCRALLKELGGLSDALRTLPDVETPATLTEQVMNALQDEGILVPSSPGAPFGVRRPHRRAISAVAAMAAVAVISTVAAFHLQWNVNTTPSEAEPLQHTAEDSSFNGRGTNPDGVTPRIAAEPPNGETTFTAGSEQPVITYGGYDPNAVTAASGTTPPPIMPYSDTKAGVNSSESINVTALLYCYGLVELPVLPDYLSEQLCCDGTNCFFPAKHYRALENALCTTGASIELEPGESFTGETGEWVQLVLVP